MVALTKVQKLKRFCLICILLTDTECKPYEIKIVLSLLRHNLYFQRTAAYKKHMFPLFLENRLAYLFRSVLCQTRVVQNLDALFFRRGCSKSGQMFEIRMDVLLVQKQTDPFSFNYSTKLLFAICTVCLTILYTPVKSYVVKWPQEKQACPSRDAPHQLLLGQFYYIALYWGIQNCETHCTILTLIVNEPQSILVSC